MDFIAEIKRITPASREDTIDWGEAERLLTSSAFFAMRDTPQNPLYHGEGDVLTHTRMVTEQLVRSERYAALSDRCRAELFLAALLHDVGKTRTTVQDGDAWIAPHHASVGSAMTREYLWRHCGLGGTPEAICFRETVCALVYHHMSALRLDAEQNTAHTARRIASTGALAADFTWDRLSMLAKADACGRIAPDLEDMAMRADYARLLAEEAGCLDSPYTFPDDYTRYAYLSGRRVAPDCPLYDDTWGEVVLMAGLPGTGKDTYIQRHLGHLPMISLDDIRRKMHVKPTDEQGVVVSAAKEQAKAYLRDRQPFVWNATNLAKDTRAKLVHLFTQYHAKVKILYLETDPDTQASRNESRENAVPTAVVNRMRAVTVLPTLDEAHTVEWLCV